jgi:hypothetical protein
LRFIADIRRHLFESLRHTLCPAHYFSQLYFFEIILQMQANPAGQKPVQTKQGRASLQPTVYVS